MSNIMEGRAVARGWMDITTAEVPKDGLMYRVKSADDRGVAWWSEEDGRYGWVAEGNELEPENITHWAVLEQEPTLSSSALGVEWQPIETAPRDGTPVLGGVTYRYLPYKPEGKRQMKSDGRWQRATDYGWEN